MSGGERTPTVTTGELRTAAESDNTPNSKQVPEPYDSRGCRQPAPLPDQRHDMRVAT